MNTIYPVISSNSVYANNSTRKKYVKPEVKLEESVKLFGNDNEAKSSKILLTLLKSGLNDKPVEVDLIKSARREDWDKVLKMAKESSVTGIAYDAVKKMPKGTVPPEVTLKMAEYIKEISAKYSHQESVIGEITEQLADKGIETVTLKGLGLSLNYPVPQHRHGRDIDIFTRYKGTVTESRSNSTDFVDDLMIDKGIKVEDYRDSKAKHSEFVYDGLNIENHKYFVNKESMSEAKMWDKILHEKLNPVEKVLPNGTKILTPSKEFNTIFIAQHAFQHYVLGGIDLHNLVDWGMHIKQNGLDVPKELKGTQLEPFMYALTNISNKYLGTDVKAPENKEYEAKIMSKIFHPVADPMPENLSKLGVFMYKTKRFIKKQGEIRKITGQSLSDAIINSVRYHLKHPKTIFR